MSRFPTAGHLCSWAKFSPGISFSAGKSKGNGSTGHGNRYLAGSSARPPWWPVGPTRFSVSATDGSPNAEGRNGPSSPSGARCWSSSGTFFNDEQTTFVDLGAEHFTRHVNPDAKKRSHIRQLEALGYTVTLTAAA